MKRMIVFIVTCIVCIICGIGLNFLQGTNEISNSVIVAVVDTGFNVDDTIDESRIIHVEDSNTNTDGIGHGTKIVQLIYNNTSDMVSIMPIKVANSNGSASIEEVCKGIRKAVDNGANIINLSMNTVAYSDSTELEELINELYDRGIFVIVSAGNEKEDTKYLAPANIDKAIVVGAMDSKKKPYFYSNYGESVDLSALGLYDGNLGTSFACAYVASYCANLMVDGCDDIESSLYKCVKRISDKEYGEGYLKWRDQYIGETDKSSEIYLGKRSKTLNEKTCDILDIDWKSLSKEELDAIIGETDYKYVGLLLNRLSESDLKEITEKSHILNTSISKLETKYNEDMSEYVVSNQTDIDYVEYCIKAYEAEKEKMLLTSDWDCRTSEAIFYLSSSDRQKIYKYVLTGLKGHAWIEGTSWKPAFKDTDLSITSSVYKDGTTSYSFTKPTPEFISTFIPSVRATRVDSYKADGTFLWTDYSWNYIGEGVDDAKHYVGISIRFKNYTNKKIGYHNAENAITMYNAEKGIGSSNEQALSYNYLNQSYGGELTSPERNVVHFNTTTPGYVKYWYKGKFKDGYNVYNATTIEESLKDWKTGEKQDIYLSTGQSSINDTSGTFTLNVIPPIGLGTQWYGSSDNKLWADSDIPEIVFNLAPNTYTVKFDGNGATGGSTTDQSMVYDVGYHLNANGFTRTGYTFAGWNTKADGTGTSLNDKHYVMNMASVDGYTVNLYASWTPNKYNMTLDHNGGGMLNGDTSNSYTVIYGYGDYWDMSWCVPIREGYTFNGFWTADGKTQIYGADGKCKNDGTYWKNGIWVYEGNAAFYAQWKTNTYEVYFDANGGDGTMDSVTFAYDTLQNLPKNLFTRENEYGPSTFLGWSTDATATAATFMDEEEVMNLAGCEEGFLTLFAIWDDCPWIIAEDLYYSLYEAQNGLITYDELMSKAEAFDKEDGAALLSGIDMEKGTSFTIIDYLLTDFTQFTASGSVTETYRAVDSVGNIFKKRITVHIVDTTPVEILPEGTTRFINEKYYNETYENGGLEDNSIWKTDSEYVAVIQEAFDNLKNNTPVISFSFTYEEIFKMKEFIRNNGIGNTKNSDALKRFYDTFMAPNMMNSKEE